jgi:hypothetical protein
MTISPLVLLHTYSKKEGKMFLTSLEYTISMLFLHREEITAPNLDFNGKRQCFQDEFTYSQTTPFYPYRGIAFLCIFGYSHSHEEI